MKSAICPYCFSEISYDQIDFTCLTCSAGKGSSGKSDSYVPFKTKKIDVKHGGIAICSNCGNTTGIKKCPNCKKRWPYDFLTGQTHIIAFVGAKGSGKSYFVGSLIKRIYKDAILADYGVATSIVDIDDKNGSGLEQYQIRYENDMQNQHLFEGTLPILTINDRPPILMQLQTFKKKFFGGERSINYFSFFDAAGENFENEMHLKTIAPYICNSETLVFVLDPCQVTEFRDGIKDVFPYIHAQSQFSYAKVIEPTIDLIRSDLKVNGKIDIPICVAFSKWDLMVGTPGLVPDDLTISQPAKLRSYDEQLTKTISDEIRSLLMNCSDGKNVVAMVENNFSSVTYFAFSAWGSPQQSNGQPPAIASYRVEDTFLWNLRNDGII